MLLNISYDCITLVVDLDPSSYDKDITYFFILIYTWCAIFLETIQKAPRVLLKT